MAGARDVAVFRRADSPDFGSRLFSRDRANKAGRPELRANKAGRIERRIKRVRIKRVGLNCAIPFAPREIAQFRTRFTPFYPDPRNMETSRPSPPHRPRRTVPAAPVRPRRARRAPPRLPRISHALRQSGRPLTRFSRFSRKHGNVSFVPAAAVLFPLRELMPHISPVPTRAAVTSGRAP